MKKKPNPDDYEYVADPGNGNMSCYRCAFLNENDECDIAGEYDKRFDCFGGHFIKKDGTDNG